MLVHEEAVFGIDQYGNQVGSIMDCAFGLLTLLKSYVLPLVVMILTFASHTLLFKQSLDASMVFSSIGVFELLREQLRMLFREIPIVIQGKVSLDRANEFFQKVRRLLHSVRL